MRTTRTSCGLMAALVLMLGTAACASSGGGTQAARSGSANRITAEELAGVSQFDLYTAISRLRPRWLQSGGSRGSAPGVVVNGIAQTGGVDSLRNYRAGDVTSVEFMDASDATTRFGTGYMGGAIVVDTGR